MQRRNKKSQEQKAEAGPPPLQPAYFDAEQAANGVPESSDRRETIDSDVPHIPEPEHEAPAVADESETSSGQQRQVAKTGDGQRGRGRRRRGGRGRGGRGREQAVARAFSPAAGKGTVPEVQDQTADHRPAPLVSEDAAELAEPAKQPVPDAPQIPAAVPAATARLPKGIVVLAIGLPGSGKSSWFKRHNVVPLSSDMVRSLLFDDVREQRFPDLVFSNLRSMLKGRLIAKRPMNYVDATNLTPQERQHWIKLAKDYNYEVHAVFFDVPLEVCVERHQRRDRVVPEDAMRRMAGKLKPPSFDEGFAKITVVRVKKKEGTTA